MKLRLISLLLLLFVIGCEEMPGTKYSGIKEETATIISMNYMPSRSAVSPGVGMTTEGDMTFSVHSTTFPEVWVVVLRCSEHNQTFALQSKDLFNRVKIGDIVTLKYVDEIRYYPYDKHNKYAEEVIDHHTKQIVFNDFSKIDRDDANGIQFFAPRGGNR